MKRKILLGLTTTPGSDWREKIREIEKFNISEIALFPTFLKLPDRKKLYRLLEKTKIKRIPHIHLREDMSSWELDYLIQRYNPQVFNLHDWKATAPFIKKNPKYVKKIFIENGRNVDGLFLELIKKCGGICLDVSHYHSYRAKKIESYKGFPKLLEKYKIGCCHVSAVSPKILKVFCYLKKKKIKEYCKYYLDDLNEVDYVKEYVKYLPKYVSIELENSFSRQLEVKKHLEKLIGIK